MPASSNRICLSWWLDEDDSTHRADHLQQRILRPASRQPRCYMALFFSVSLSPSGFNTDGSDSIDKRLRKDFRATTKKGADRLTLPLQSHRIFDKIVSPAPRQLQRSFSLGDYLGSHSLPLSRTRESTTSRGRSNQQSSCYIMEEKEDLTATRDERAKKEVVSRQSSAQDSLICDLVMIMLEALAADPADLLGTCSSVALGLRRHLPL